jgi:hypothetical protein
VVRRISVACAIAPIVPGMEVVGDPKPVKARLLGHLSLAHELARAELLAGEEVADAHGPPFGIGGQRRCRNRLLPGSAEINRIAGARVGRHPGAARARPCCDTRALGSLAPVGAGQPTMRRHDQREQR